jgi:hypothetical protein
MLSSREQVVGSKFGMFYFCKTFIFTIEALRCNANQPCSLLPTTCYLDYKEDSL